MAKIKKTMLAKEMLMSPIMNAAGLCVKLLHRQKYQKSLLIID